jgi:hypothetical protein
MLRFATVLSMLSYATAPLAAQPRLSPADCARIVAHAPEPSVTWRPGVDTLGRAVAPADLASPQLVAPPRIEFMLSVDLARRLDLAPGLVGDLPLGIVSVEGSRLLFNGRPLSDAAQAELAAACAAAGR